MMEQTLAKAFTHYPSILKYDLYARKQGGPWDADAEWVVTEKIHGANFCFLVSDPSRPIACARRNGIIAEGEVFNNHIEVLAENEAALYTLFHNLTLSHGPFSHMAVYGEIFGGVYKHPLVPRRPDITHVAKGVQYCPDIRFCAFDVRLHTPAGPIWLAFDDMRQALIEAGVFCVEPLFRGPLDQALGFDVETFQSTIPSRLGLPALANNIAEGVVVRHATAHRCFKVKSSHYRETTGELAQSVKVAVNRAPTVLDPEAAALLPDLLGHVTDMRLDNVLSKSGEIVTVRNVRQIAGQLAGDAFAEFVEGLSEEQRVVVMKHRKTLTLSLNTGALGLVGARIESGGSALTQ